MKVIASAEFAPGGNGSTVDQSRVTDGKYAASEQFAAIVAHDLESSLLAVSKNAEALREVGPHLSEEQEGHLAGIERTAQRMKGLLNGVRNLQRASVELDSVALESVIAEVMETLAPLAAERGAEVVVETPLPTVIADRNQLVQLFQNLILNAIKFGPQGTGRVTLSAVSAPGAWRIAVVDHGPGIAPQERDQVFEPFSRLRATSNQPGSGLGLAICRRVAENHGGSLIVQSSPGGGATFVFTLPELGLVAAARGTSAPPALRSA